MAGLLALAARQGARVVVLSATRGEGGYDHVLPDRSPAEVGAARTAELAASCLAMGAELPRFLGWADGAVAAVDRGEALAALIEVVHAVDPEVLISLGADGAYGYADHLALWDLTGRAFDAAERDGASATSRWLSAEFPSDLFVSQWHRMTQGRHADRVAADPPELGKVVAEVALRLRLEAPSLSAVREMKRAAIASHRSQLPDATPESLFPAGVVDRLMREEWYRVVRGPALPPGATDPFAGLD